MEKQKIFSNLNLFKGDSDTIFKDASIWIDGNIIKYAGPSSEFTNTSHNIERVDLGGKTVIPGMTESHAHISYTNNGPLELDKTPIEEAMIKTVDNARIMLGSGFTSAISFGSVHRIDVFLRDAINNGQIAGPRLLAGGRDICAIGGNADTYPDHAKPQTEGLAMITDGPWEIRKAVRTLWKNGVDVVKVMIDGELISLQGRPGDLGYKDEEVEALVDEAHRKKMKVACHARSAEAVKQAVRSGIDFIGHANYIDSEALDLLIENKDRVYVGPAIAWEMAFLENAEKMGFKSDSREVLEYQKEVEETISSYRKMKEAGIKILVGGDYGLDIAPHGTYAKDLEHYVNLFGFSNAEALHCATSLGGEAMGNDGLLGTLEEGKLADLVIIDGNPLEDITILQDHKKIKAVMKDGLIYQGLTNEINPYLNENL
tara:strand:- start:3917 stop:5203 length:1287 start_codon:yes stop_codon:yes gene_type:complete